MLKADNLTFSYSRKTPPVLNSLSLSVEPGGIYGLLGLNGVGKTTLLNLMAGLLTPKSGNVTLNGTNTRKRLPETLGDIFFVPEEFALPSMTVREYARLTGKFYPRYSSEDMNRCLDTFGLRDCDMIADLSMGQRKKALLSFAIACNTSLLLLDEPTNGLDLPGKKALKGLLASSVDETRSVVLSTHQIADIQNIIDHLIVMRNGKILFNVPLSTIGERFCFELTNSPAVIADALYRQPIFSGNIVILPNDDGRDTEIDLETFFYFSTEQPETVCRLLS
ncbi:MAG: ABC transporter ATP-binding protein [Duncaniella sp.]|nr:ABC transporter ATP-binding protein [Duncaniella sp.]